MARTLNEPAHKRRRSPLPALAAGATALALAGGGLALFAGGAGAAVGNLVANGGFESGLGGWSCTGGATAVSSPVHSGNGALQATPGAGDTAECSQTISVLPNTSYTLSAWVQGPYVYLGARGTGGTDPSTWSNQTGWNQLSTGFTTGANASSVTVYLHGWYGQGGYLADDVTLTGPGGSGPTTPPTTPPTGGPTTPPPNVALPVAPYIDMGAWPTPSMPDMARAGGARGYSMGFVTGVGCKASWFNAYDPRTGWAKDQVDALRAAGGDVKLSFGGAAGTELAAACTSVDSLFNEYDAVVNAYDLRYVDYDIEGAAIADTASNDRRSAALAKLQQAHPGLKVSLTLPVLPEGLTGDGVAVVKSARDAGVNLDLVNVMAMDYYRSGTDYGNAAVQAARSTFGQLKALYPAKTDTQLWAMVGVTPMIGENDDHQIYDQAAAQQLVTFAKQNHLGLLAFWDATRDANACTGGSLAKCTNVPQQPYEFAKIFSQYTG